MFEKTSEKMQLKNILNERNLPELKSREEMLQIMQNEVYGFLPPKPDNVSFNVTENTVGNFCAGKAVLNKVVAECKMGEKIFSFPFYAAMPTDGKKHPFFIHINFRDNVPDIYMPTEELVDNGFAVLSFCYKDVTSDNGDFTNGLAGVLYKNGERNSPCDAGKIALWAWAAQRVMDYAETIKDALDLDCSVVCGHSRLGKTALFCAATDERFKFAYSNDSGCSGAAITRDKQGENVRIICERFPYWFCENYKKYVDNEHNMPFDQHYLVASIAPRRVLIGSASEDIWADPVAEQLCCLAAGSAFEKGFVFNGKVAEIGEEFLEGDVGYHLRKGLHYFSREDWHKLIKFIDSHR